MRWGITCRGVMVGFHDVGVESRRNSQQGWLGAKQRENI